MHSVAIFAQSFCITELFWHAYFSEVCGGRLAFVGSPSNVCLVAGVFDSAASEDWIRGGATW